MIHASSPIFPACLAAGEANRVNGKEFLAAYALGIEAACRIGSVIAPNYRETASYWHITSICGVFGAAAAAGRLLKLQPDAMACALGIAGTQASGLRQVFGSMCKPFHTGHAAKSGLLATLLARGGFTSTKDILEGKRGFVAVMATGYDLDKAMADLGERWELPMVGIKPYACGVGKHGLIDAILALRSKEGVTPDTVERITGSVRAFKSQETLRHPTTGVQASFSYHHSMAVALLGRGVVAATAVLKDGRTLKEVVEHPTGSPECPMTDKQVEAKFRALTLDALPQDHSEALLNASWQLENIADLGDLASLIRSDGRRKQIAGVA
jgi:2-methylcitrate dehydratase PrpD